MNKQQSVTASIEVHVDPQTAFRIFTEEIDAWWVRGPINFYNAARAVGLRFEPGLGGRFLEIYDDTTGDALEVGRITLWEPGRRFVYLSSLDDTEVDIRFDSIPDGTRVSVEQRLVPGGENAHFLSGWANILGWFADRTDWPGGSAPPQRDIPRVSPVLHYRDVPAACEWLVRVFGLRTRHRMRVADFGELALGESVIMLRELDPSAAVSQNPITHSIYCYVDDLDDHFEHAKAGGAAVVESIKRHGDRSYVADDLEGHRWTFAQARPSQR